MHGLIFETSVCYWQNQPGCYLCSHHSPQKGENDEKILSSKGRHFFNNVTMRFTTTDMIINNLDQLLTGEMFHYLWCITILPSHAEYAFLIFPKPKGVFMLQKRSSQEGRTYLKKDNDHVIQTYTKSAITTNSFRSYNKQSLRAWPPIPIMNSTQDTS